MKGENISVQLYHMRSPYLNYYHDAKCAAVPIFDLSHLLSVLPDDDVVKKKSQNADVHKCNLGSLDPHEDTISPHGNLNVP